MGDGARDVAECVTPTKRALTMAPYSRNRGVALPIVIFVLAMLGSLVTAAFWSGVLDHRTGRAALDVQQALGLAESAVADPLANWAAGGYTAVPVGRAVADTVRWESGAIKSVIRVRRLGVGLFLIGADGLGRSGAVAHAGVLVRLEPWGTPAVAPVLANGPVNVGPLAEVRFDATGSERGCTSLRESDPDTKFGFGSRDNLELEDFSRWVGRATKQVAPGRYVDIGPVLQGGVCIAAEFRNWGDPTGESGCGSYRPVVYVAGDLTLFGGSGQGVLLVGGDLDIRGGFFFEGLILVGGSLRATVGAPRIEGAVQAGLVGGGAIRLGGRALVVYSRCAVDMALLASGRLVPIGSRGWFYGPW